MTARDTPPVEPPFTPGRPVRVPVAVVAGLLTILVVWGTWPFAASLASGVTDLGDPLLNAWALSWNAHALATNPAELLHGNIFHPERATLAYSELLWLPSLALAPLLWAGADPIFVHNLLVLGGFVLSGLGMFVLVRRLTGQDLAALVAAVAFAIYPYRTDMFPKVQLTLTMWWPVALLALHEVVTTRRVRPIVALALALAAACYSSVYLGVYGGIGIAVIGVGLLATTTHGRVRVAQRLVAAGLLASLMALPLAVPYRAAATVVGERSVGEMRQWSAAPSDYGQAHPESWLYGRTDRVGRAERHLFPGVTTAVLSLAAFASPIAPAAPAYALGGIASVVLSFGTNVPGFTWLVDHVTILRALRVPARFGLVVGAVLSVLAGLGFARLIGRRSVLGQLAITAIAVVTIASEGAMRRQEIAYLPEPRPAVYAWLAEQPDGVVAEYPLGQLEGRAGPQDPTYMYYSTRHWKPLVNGYSGFAPPSYVSLVEALADFPDDRALAALRARRVTYLLVHQPFYIHGDFEADVLALRQRRDLRWMGRFRWRSGKFSDAFRLIAEP